MTGDATDIKRWERYRQYLAAAKRCSDAALYAGSAQERKELREQADYWYRHANHQVH